MSEAENADSTGFKHVDPVELPQDAALAKHNRNYAFKVVVPSLGNLYDGRFPGGEVIISPMTIQEEKILASQGKDKSEIIDELLQRCILSLPVPYPELLIPDMFYLLLQVRNVTYGLDYRFNMTCRSCSTEYITNIQLPNGLDLVGLSENDTEPFSCTLPMCKQVVEWRYLRNKDEVDIRKYTRAQYTKSHTFGEPGYIYRIAKQIVSIGGVKKNMIEVLDFVEKLHARDSTELRKSFKAQSFGANLKIRVECPRCGKEEEDTLPFDQEFFRPGSLTE